MIPSHDKPDLTWTACFSDDALLKTKSNQHVLEKLSVRMEKVRRFLTLFKPDIVPDIVPIHDVYGPTAWDPDIQALVVSKETLSGADASTSKSNSLIADDAVMTPLPVAKYRAQHNLPALQTFLIDVISSTTASLDHEDAEWLKKHKLSSTYIRQWIVDHNKEEEEEGEEESLTQ